MKLNMIAAGLVPALLLACAPAPEPAPPAATTPPVVTAPAQPAVGSSTDLTPFTGARAGQAEMGIQNLGYTLIRTEGLTAYWFNRETGACAEVVTDQGRYSTIRMLPAEDC